MHRVADGFSNKEMAEKLGPSPQTSDRHGTNMMEKNGVHSVAQLLAYALKEGSLDRHHYA
ncbi:MAG: helix-turn-helix transcriptional regulator [Pseudomonadota bacterium]